MYNNSVAYSHWNEMDENQVLQMYATTNKTMAGWSCVGLLPYIDFEEREEREMNVFQSRLQLIICASHEFKVAMFKQY